jgi:MFS family permease
VSGTTAPADDVSATPARWLLLRYPDLARIWLGHSLSLLGSHLSTLALPLLVLDATGSPALAGLVGTTRMLTYLVSNLPAGALADRLPRRSLLVLADVLRAAAVLVVGIALSAGHTPSVVVLLAVGAVDTAVSAVAGPAGTASLRHLVSPDDIPRALVLDNNRRLALGLVGPLVGGALYQLAPALPFLLDGITYGASLLLILSVRRHLGGGASTTSTLRQDVADGIRFVVRTRFVLLFMIWATLVNFATGGMTFGVVILIGPDHAAPLGVAMAVLTLAGIVGSTLAPRLFSCGQQRLVQVSTASSVVVGIVIALFPNPVVAVALVAARSLIAPAAGILFNTRVFELVPDAMTGRVQSALYLVGGALTPFATLVSGWLCEQHSPSTAFAVFAAMLAAVLVLTCLPAMRQPSATPNPA